MSPTKQINALTGIRAVAVLMVASLHFLQGIPETTNLMGYFRYGFVGVDLFFVLSGYINAHVYFVTLEQPTFRAALVYWWRRLIRIWPAQVAVLIVIALHMLANGNRSVIYFQYWPLDELTLTQAWRNDALTAWNPVSWSISAEWFAYLLFPFLVPLIRNVRTASSALLLAVSALTILCSYLHFSGVGLSVWYGAPALSRAVLEFIAGVFIWRLIALSPRPLVNGDVVGIAGLIVAATLVTRQENAILMPFAMAAIIYGAATSTGVLKTVLSARPVMWLGVISYSVYISHAVLFWLIRLAFQGADPILMNLTCIIGAFAFAIALFYLVEDPIRRRFHYGLRRRQKRTSTSENPVLS